MNEISVLALGGYSESGKSSSGRYLEKAGYARFKIADIYRRLYALSDSPLSFVEWSNWIDQNRPDWIGEQFLSLLLEDLRQAGTNKCTIESLYGDTLALQLKKHLGDNFKIVFIDISRDIRLQRQMQRESLDSIDAAAKMLDPRDEMKRAWGADRLKEIADFIVDNSGPPSALEAQLDAIASGSAV
jgi:hypothetical protein